MHDVFLCHNGADKPWAKKLAADIESEEHDGRKLKAWLDEWDIDLGENILLKISEGLKESRHVAVLLSPEMLASEWCKLEVTATLSKDPANRAGRLILLLVRDEHKKNGDKIEIPPYLQPFLYIDFRSPRDYKKNLARLLLKLKGERPPRASAGRRKASRKVVAASDDGGESPGKRREDADEVKETLVSNALPVTLPPMIWSAPSMIDRKKDLPAGQTYPGFIIRGVDKEKRIFTFEDLSAPGIHQVFSRKVMNFHQTQKQPSATWVDPERGRWLIELLNETLRHELGRQGVRVDRGSGRYYFLPTKEGGTRQVSWASGKGLTVARAPDEGKAGSWVHQAAHLHFARFAERVWLAIEPTYHFTVDGYHAVSSDVAKSLAPLWGQRERNDAILGHVLFWADFLAGFNATGELGPSGNAILVERLPVTAEATHGLIGDKIRKRSLHRILEEHMAAVGKAASEGAPRAASERNRESA